MSDWQQLVRRRLSGIAVDAAEKEEICAELAAHLEENCEGLLQRGLPEDEAVRRTLSQVADWPDLQRRIQKARTKENTMTDRVKQFWLPSLLTMLLSMGLLALIQIFGPKPWLVGWDGKSPWTRVAPMLMVYVPWLMSLPFIGAIGAYLSNRAGGSRRAVFSSVLSPVVPYLAFFVVALPIVAFLNGHIAHNIMSRALFVGLFAWVLAPGAALLAGGWPAQFIFSRRLDSGRVVSS